MGHSHVGKEGENLMLSLDDLNKLEPESEVFDPQERQRDEWMAKRHGKITCSMFPAVMQTGRTKDEVFGATAMAYLRMVAAERLGSWHAVEAGSMRWGTENEAAAIDEYRKRTGLEVDSEPFQFFDFNADVGGTPDGLVGNDGCLEIKCPFNPAQHVETLVSRQVPRKYLWQCVGHMMVTGRSWCDFGSFDPRIPENDDRRLCIVRLERDAGQIAALVSRLEEAAEKVNQILRLTSNADATQGA